METTASLAATPGRSLDPAAGRLNANQTDVSRRAQGNGVHGVTFDAAREARPVVTLVLRLWPVGPPHRPRAVRYQATHVQSGEAAYFQTLECLAQHVEHVAEHLLLRASHRPPIEFPLRRVEPPANTSEDPNP